MRQRVKWWARRKERFAHPKSSPRHRERKRVNPESPKGKLDCFVADGDMNQLARISARIMSAAFSPIMMLGALVLPPISVGMTEASAMRRPSRP
jgi:hypothetical protein